MDYWWFFHSSFKAHWDYPNPSHIVPPDDSRYSRDAIKTLLTESSDWIPFSRLDSLNCERSLNNGSHQRTAVLPHKLVAADVQLMLMEPIYWPGSKCPLRRSNWFIIGTEDCTIPLPPSLSSLLDATCMEVDRWIGNGRCEGVVEKAVDLGRPFQDYMVVFRKGAPEQAWLRLVANAHTVPESDGKASRCSGDIEVIRGYSNMCRSRGNLSFPGADDEAATLDAIPRHLLFVIHGIGQKMAGKMGSGFIRDVNVLRSNVDDSCDKRGIARHSIAVLPIFWRMNLKLPARYYRDEFSTDASGFDLALSKIVPSSIPLVRNLCSDVALDILLYMTPRYRSIIIAGLISEMKRVYDLFSGQNPEFAGHVHFFAHSLGAVLLADIVSQNLCPFPVHGFFAVGSSVPLFYLLQHQRPIGCIGVLVPSKDCRELDEELPESVVLHCQSFYNIYHPHDPIAYRIEPIVDEDASFSLPAVSIPSHKFGLLNMKMKMDEKIEKVRGSLFNMIRGFSTARPDNINSPNTGAEAAGAKYPLFNKRGRLDYVLQEGLVESAYVSALTAHFCYWSDADVSMFVVGEIA